MVMPNNCLIYDIETSTNGASFQELEKHKLRFFGAYSYLDKKYYLLDHTQKEEIKQLISRHKFFIGFNNHHYDNPILEREGIRFTYKIIIDLKKIIDQRQMSIKWKTSVLGYHLPDLSLNTITRILELVDNETAKGDIDYKILDKEEFTKEEYNEIKKYTIRDIEITKKLWEWIFDYFKDSKELMSLKDANDLKYLTSSTAVFAYKHICKICDLKEIYDSNKISNKNFSGGYVAHPTGETFKGDILLFDFSSLYPNLFIMGNLFANNCDCCSEKEKWTGDGFFNIKGGTCKKKLHLLSEALKNVYLKRAKLKSEKNPKEYFYKIVINSLYGAVSNPVFKNIYNLTAAENCTSLGRQFILYARKRFREEGYKNIMSDTDSVMILIPKNKNKYDAQILADTIVEELLIHMPFDW